MVDETATRRDRDYSESRRSRCRLRQEVGVFSRDQTPRRWLVLSEVDSIVVRCRQQRKTEFGRRAKAGNTGKGMGWLLLISLPLLSRVHLRIRTPSIYNFSLFEAAAAVVGSDDRQRALCLVPRSGVGVNSPRCQPVRAWPWLTIPARLVSDARGLRAEVGNYRRLNAVAGVMEY